MKKLFVILASVAFLFVLSSCDQENIRNTSSPADVPPYVVTKIKECYLVGHSKYITHSRSMSNSDSHIYAYRMVFIEKSGKFAVGDTVNVLFYKNGQPE